MRQGECECGCGNPAPIAKYDYRSKGHVKGQPVRFISGHNSKPVDFRTRFHQGGPDECWPWLGSITDQGYGRITHRIGERRFNRRVQEKAHRAVFEWLVGPIPSGLDLDHLCHNEDPTCEGGVTCPHRRCVNPAHLEPVTRRVNLARGRGTDPKLCICGRIAYGNGGLSHHQRYCSVAKEAS